MSENVQISEILAMLDVDVMAKEFGIRHYTIRESYSPKRMTVSSYDEFMELMCDYYRIHYLRRYNTNESVQMPEHYLHGMVRTLLDHLFSSNGGMEFAYSMCVRGIDGGIKTVLDRIYQYFLNEDEEMYANMIIDRAIKLDWQNRLELVKQYQMKFKSELGNSIKMKDPNRLAMNIKSLILNHIKTVAQIKMQIGDY